MAEDVILFGLVCLVWAALALLYAVVPMFSMPGSAVVWGSGALIFLGLTVAIAIREMSLTTQTDRR